MLRDNSSFAFISPLVLFSESDFISNLLDESKTESIFSTAELLMVKPLEEMLLLLLFCKVPALILVSFALCIVALFSWMNEVASIFTFPVLKSKALSL